MAKTGFLDKPLGTEEAEEEEKPRRTGGGGFLDTPLGEGAPPAPVFAAPDPAEYKAARLAALAPLPQGRRARPGRPSDIVGPGLEAAKTGLGYLGEGLDIALTRPVKTAAQLVGGGVPELGGQDFERLRQRMTQPDVSAIAPARQAEALELAKRAPPSKPAPPITLSEAWEKSAQPQWETAAEVRTGKLNADPSTGDYIIGVPAEFMTDISLILGLGAVTLPEKAGRLGLRIKPAMLGQLAGMIERRAALEPLEAVGKLGRLQRVSKWIGQTLKKAGVSKVLGAAGTERKVALPGKLAGRIGRKATALRALTKAEPAVKPKAGLARVAFEAGAEPTGARVAEQAFAGTEEAIKQLDPGFWKRTGLDLSDVEKAKATQAAEYMERFVAGDTEAAANITRIIGGDKRIGQGAKALYEGERGVTAARHLGDVPFPSITARTERKLAKATARHEARLAKVTARGVAERGKKTVGLIKGEKAAVAAAERAKQLRAGELAQLTAKKKRAELKLGARVKGRAQKIFEVEGPRYTGELGKGPPGLPPTRAQVTAKPKGPSRPLLEQWWGETPEEFAKRAGEHETRFARPAPTTRELLKPTSLTEGMKKRHRIGAVAQWERAVDPALAAERAAKAVEKGAPLGAIKADLFRAFGKEGYAQALHEAKTLGQLRGQILALQRRTTDRGLKKTLGKITSAYDRKFGKLDVTLAARGHKRLVRTIESKGFKRTQALIPELVEAKAKAPTHITRNLTPEGRKWLSEASLRTKPEAISRPIHSLSGSTLERTFADPKTGRSMYLDEINEMLERTLVDSDFAKKHSTWAEIAKKADAKRGPPTIRQTLGGKEKMPLVSHVFETDPHKILDTSINRAIMDAEQSGFVRELAKVGSPEKQRGWTHVKKLVSKDRPNPAMKELVDQIGDLYFPPEVMDELKRTVTNLTDASAQKRIVKMYDKALGAWKYSVTAPFPAFHARNVTSNLVMIVGNGVRAESEIILDSTKYITGKGFIKIGEISMPAGQFARKMKAWKISGGLGREVAGVLGATDEAFRGGYAADRLREAIKKFPGEYFYHKGRLPVPGRLTATHWQFARDQVNKTLGNYRDIGKTGKFLQRTALPFWKWTRHSVPQHVEWLFTKPYMLNAEAKAAKVTGQWTKRRAGTLLGTGNPLEDTADFVDMAKDIVSGKGADAWRKGAWRFTPPVANVGLAIKNFVQGGKPVRAPRGAEYMPDSWRRVFGIREVDGQIVMPSHGKDIAKLLRLFNEVRKHSSGKSTTESWVRTLTGVGKSDASQAEDDLSRLYDDLDKIMKSLRAKRLTKPGLPGRDVPARAARREPEYRDYLKVKRDLKRIRAILKRERAVRRRARPLPQSAPRRPLPR